MTDGRLPSPRYIVTKAPGTPGLPIPEDEPCLVIRAQDVLALAMMREYIRRATEIGVSPEVMSELYGHEYRLETWRAENPSKIKLPDR